MMMLLIADQSTDIEVHLVIDLGGKVSVVDGVPAVT